MEIKRSQHLAEFVKLDDELLHLPVHGPWLRYKAGEEPEENESPGNEVIAK